MAATTESTITMWRNHLMVAIRSLSKKRFYTIINIAGLALGLMAAIFIWQDVSYERSFDEFHDHANRIFRLATVFETHGGQLENDASNAAPVGPALKAEFAEVEDFVRISPEYGRMVLQYGDQTHEQHKVYYVDSNFLQFFDHEIIQGDPHTALVAPYSIVLTRSAAERYFGPREHWTETYVGRSLRVNQTADYQITAIIEDPPPNTHFRFGSLLSFTTFPITNGDPSNEWEWNDFYTYILLGEAAQMHDLEPKLRAFADRHINQKGTEGYTVSYLPQSLKGIHLNSRLGYELQANGDATTTNFLFLIAVCILLIAWANYINLSTAQAEDRAEEVGIRKVIGANRRSLITQFLIEALVVNTSAVALAILLVFLLQPWMNALTGKTLEAFAYFPISVPGVFLLLSIGSTLISGIYPSVVLSGYSPSKSLQPQMRGGPQQWLRKGLVTFQYMSSIVLIIGTFVVFRQLDFMKSADLGFSADHKLILNAPSIYTDSVHHLRYQTFKTKLLQHPTISSVTASSAIPGKFYNDLDNWGGIRMQSADDSQKASFTLYRVDDHYYETYGLQVIAGQAFSNETTADDRSLAVNEAALQLLGFDDPKEAIGQKVRMQSDRRIFPISNVFRNYHHKSLRHNHEPTILWNFIPDPLYYSIKYHESASAEPNQLLRTVSEIWEEVFPDNPFVHTFFEDQYNDQYTSDSRLGRIIAVFALFAVFIACLGILGMTSYMIAMRTKELGIRKVLGASVRSIVLVLSMDFVWLIVLASLVAIPIAFVLASRWLENFAYKTSLDWWLFATAGVLTLVTAMVTVSFQSVRAALKNPIDALRTE